MTGRVMETPSSITGTTLVFSSLATGTVTSGKYGAKWILRPDAASQPTNRVRLSTETGFASATGTITHAGAAYTDTTAGTESVELCEYEPYLLDDAIQQTIQSINRNDRTEIPTRQGATRYWLWDLPWIDAPKDIVSVALRHSPVLSRNRHFEKWMTPTTAGVLQPDSWTVSGGTVTRSTTRLINAQYEALLTVTGGSGEVTLEQTVGLLETGILGTSGSLRGQQVTATAIVFSNNGPNTTRIWVTSDNYSTVTYSPYHAGTGTWQELTTGTVTLPSTATNVIIGIDSTGSDGETCEVADFYLTFGAMNDSVRRDDYPEADITSQVRYEQGGTSLAMIAPTYAYGSQIIVYSQRPYSGFDQTRLTGGTADADVQDAPLTIVALGALWRLYDGLRLQFPELASQAAHWRSEYEQIAEPMIDDPGDGRDGLSLPTLMASGGRRF